MSLKLLLVFVAVLLVVVNINCSPKHRPGISKDEAISIAKGDAIEKYAPLERFDVEVMDERKVWHVIFYLKNEELDGGTPEYFISKQTGAIIQKWYFQ